MVDESSYITCYSESEMLSISENLIWSLSESNIHTESYSRVDIARPVSIYGELYSDDKIYYLDHESINGLEYEANENEGGEVSLTSSIMHIEGTTKIITESGAIASSQFKISITDIINGE